MKEKEASSQLKKFAMLKVYFSRGRELIYLVQFLMITVLFAQTFNNYFNLDFNMFLIITLFSVITASSTMGYIDYKYGIWRSEIEQEANLNPFNMQGSKMWKETLAKVSRENDVLKKIEQKLKHINV